MANRKMTLEARVARLEKLIAHESKDMLVKRLKDLVSSMLDDCSVSYSVQRNNSYITISDNNEDDFLDTDRDNFEVYRIIDNGTTFKIIVNNGFSDNILGDFTNVKSAANAIVKYRVG